MDSFDPLAHARQLTLAARAAAHATSSPAQIVGELVRRVLSIKATPATYTGIVSGLRQVLSSAWKPVSDELIEGIVSWALDNAGIYTEGQLKRHIDRYQRDLASAGIWDEWRARPLGAYLAAAYQLGKAEVAKPMGWSVDFSLADQDAVHGLQRAGLFWVGKFYGDGLPEKRILEVVGDVLVRQGLGREAAGEALRRELGTAVGERGQAYWSMFAGVVATRARSFGALQGMIDTGATRYRYTNPDDERTSDVCRELNGAEFTVKAAVDLRERLLATANSPDEWKALAPWPRNVEAVRGADGMRLPEGELLAKGIAWPPLHGNCRSSIDVVTWAPISSLMEQPTAPPKKAKAPPKPKPPPKPVDRASVIMHQKTGAAAGSNEGGFYTGSDGVRRYVKFYKDPGQAAGEHLTNRIYNDLGILAPKSELFRLADGRLAYASEILDAEGTLSAVLPTLTTTQRKKAAERALSGFAADVLTANWDAAGLSLDNMVAVKGQIARIDNGGAMLSRAQGARKSAAHLAPMAEWGKYFDGSNPGYKRLASTAGVERAQDIPDLDRQIEAIIALRKKSGGWAKYVAADPELNAADRAAIVAMLEDRTDKLAIKLEDLKKLRHIEALDVKRTVAQATTYGNASLIPARGATPAAELAAVKTYTGHAYSSINRNLRAGGALTADDKRMDKAISRARLPADLVIFRGVNNCPPLEAMVKDGALSEGNTNTDWGYGSSGVARSVAEAFAGSGSSSIVFRILAPKGTPAMWVDDFPIHKGEVEVLNPRNTTLRVLRSQRDHTGRWVVDAEIIPAPAAAVKYPTP